MGPVSVEWSELKEDILVRLDLLRRLSGIGIAQMGKCRIRIDSLESLYNDIFKYQSLICIVQVLAFVSMTDSATVIKPEIILMIGRLISFPYIDRIFVNLLKSALR